MLAAPKANVTRARLATWCANDRDLHRPTSGLVTDAHWTFTTSSSGAEPKVIMMRLQVRIALLLALATSVAPRAFLAQKFPGFGGAGFRAGAANPKNASVGGAYALDADLGYLWRPALRTYVGLDGFLANTDLNVAGADVGGSIKGFGLATGVRYDVIPTRSLSPYGLLGLSFSDVSARDVSDPATSELLDGFYTELVYGIGVAWHLGRRHTWSLVGDLRGVSGSDVGRAVLTAGVRWTRRGREAYTPEARAPEQPPVTPAPTPPPPPAGPRAEADAWRSWR